MTGPYQPSRAELPHLQGESFPLGGRKGVSHQRQPLPTFKEGVSTKSLKLRWDRMPDCRSLSLHTLLLVSGSSPRNKSPVPRPASSLSPTSSIHTQLPSSFCHFTHDLLPLRGRKQQHSLPQHLASGLHAVTKPTLALCLPASVEDGQSDKKGKEISSDYRDSDADQKYLTSKKKIQKEFHTSKGEIKTD